MNSESLLNISIFIKQFKYFIKLTAKELFELKKLF